MGLRARGILKDAGKGASAVALALVLCGCEQEAPSSVARLDNLSRGTLADGSQAFTIDLPPGCQMKSRGMAIDFDVFDVTCDGVGYVGIYAGNFADKGVPRSRLLKTPWAWPSEIQVWTQDAAGDQAQAERIAASVKLRR